MNCKKVLPIIHVCFRLSVESLDAENFKMSIWKMLTIIHTALGLFPLLKPVHKSWPLVKIIKIILWTITFFFFGMIFYMSVGKKGQECLSIIRTICVSVKYVYQPFSMQWRSSRVCFLQWLFLELLKRFALIRPHGSFTKFSLGRI